MTEIDLGLYKPDAKCFVGGILDKIRQAKAKKGLGHKDEIILKITVPWELSKGLLSVIGYVMDATSATELRMKIEATL